jgi:hypothetical protein
MVQFLLGKYSIVLSEYVFNLTEQVFGRTSTIFEMIDDTRLREVTQTYNVVLLQLLSHDPRKD